MKKIICTKYPSSYNKSLTSSKNRKLNKKILASSDEQWKKIKAQLRSEAEDGIDSLYELTSAGEYIQDTCKEVEDELGIWLEPSIQGGFGGIWFYSNDDDRCLASDYDYRDFNDNVFEYAVYAKSEDKFKSDYRYFLERILENPDYACEE